MERPLKTLTELLAACAVCVACLLAFAGTALAADYYEVNVDNTTDLKAAVNEAQENATEETPYKIIVAPGDYDLDYCLYLTSNIYLYAQGCYFTQTEDADTLMIRTGPDKETIATSECAGYYYENITIDGGTWDKNGAASTVFQLCHATNITVQNCTLRNDVNGHLMETAGVDGLTVTNCTFEDQVLDSSAGSKTTYEAIQLDILQEDHLGGYYSEDLPMKNVSITNCTFQDVPRAIGAHTAVLNNPLDGLTITGNTISGTGSAAIQLMGVKNVTISDNTITDAARGIFVYNYRTTGTFWGSKLNSSSTTSTKYQTPTDYNIIISDNSITLNSSDDAYDTWQKAGILVGGLLLEEDTDGAKGGTESIIGGTMEAGNYYITGVTVANNTVNVRKGYGIRFDDVWNSTLSNNTITDVSGSAGAQCHGIVVSGSSSNDTVTNNSISGFYHGIMVNESSVKSITSNTISGPSTHGIFVYDSSTVTSIQSNKITSPGTNGIFVYGSSTATTVKSNTVSSAGNNGIYVYDSSTIGTLQNNKITSAGNHGVMVYDGSTVKTLSSNTISKPTGHGIMVYSSSKATTIQSNTVTSPKGNGIMVGDGSTASKVLSNKVSSAKGNGIMVYSKSKATTVQSNTVSSASGQGITVSTSSTVTTLKSNKVSAAGKYGVMVYDSSTATTISSNTITKPGKYGIFVGKKSKAVTISSNTIKNGTGKGISINSLKCNLKLSKNTVSGCKGVAIFLYPQTTSYKITLSSNKVTGKSKKYYGIQASKAKVVLKSNTIKKCSNAVYFTNTTVGSIYKNKMSNNKSNKYRIGSKTYSNPKKGSKKAGKTTIYSS